MNKILFATSEIYPLIKTGGLADVSASLPKAIATLGEDIRIVVPAYPSVIQQLNNISTVTTLNLHQAEVRILESTYPDTDIKMLLVDCPFYFHRPDNPYLDQEGQPWQDNACRFALFSRAIVEIAVKRIGLPWYPDLVHCHDWQTALVPALLSLELNPPATLFTIHNLAYQGLFPRSTFTTLGLPQTLWSHNTLEFHEQISFIKGGLVFADRINTVSPTYSAEIQTPEFGFGLDGLLVHRQERLSGIINGVDNDEWNPATDTFLIQTYDSDTLSNRKINKKILQSEFELPEDEEIALFGFIGRLVEQKGIDVILKSLKELVKSPIQLIFLGSGEATFEKELQQWADRNPNQIGVKIGYNETLSHQIEGGVDIFLMPSRFEPCGLNQMYSQLYGAIPIVRKAGGLADTVCDATPSTLADSTASGIVFEDETPEAFLEAVDRALSLFSNKTEWKKLQITAMKRDFSWQKSAQLYIQLYQQAIIDRQPPATRNNTR